MEQSRRNFFRYSIGSLIFLTSPLGKAKNNLSVLSNLDLKNKNFKKLSCDAYKTTTLEGEWILSNIEGKIPEDINGKFLKIGPGTKDLFGVPFNHFFDGDAYISEFNVKPDQIILKTSFLNTFGRSEEQLALKMLYHEFGTRSPEKKNKGRKNQPNINLISWNKTMLALSEGGHPFEVDSGNLSVKSVFNFNDSLPEKVSFTAHPKIDPETKMGYAFGTFQGMSKALKVFKMNHENGALEELYSLNQKHVYMIHDMIMTKDHIIFVIPPAYFSIKDIILDKKAMSETLIFDKNEPTRVLVLAKDGKSDPKEFTLPARMVFHNGNAYEENGVITFQTFMSNNDSLLKLINQWQSTENLKADAPDMYEVKINLNSNKLISADLILRSHDFPIINDQYLSFKNKFLYCASMGNSEDPMAFNGLSKFNLSSRSNLFYPMKKDEMCGEPFYVPKKLNASEDDGYLAYIGFNQNLNQSFLEILDATNMNFLARVWANNYIPLGFHGHFISN